MLRAAESCIFSIFASVRSGKILHGLKDCSVPIAECRDLNFNHPVLGQSGRWSRALAAPAMRQAAVTVLSRHWVLPTAREMAAACFSRHRRPDRIRVRDGSPSGSTRWAFDSGSTRSATARPRAAGTRPGPQRPGISDTTASIGAPAVRRPLGLRSDGLHAVLMSKPWCLRSRVPLRSQSC